MPQTYVRPSIPPYSDLRSHYRREMDRSRRDDSHAARSVCRLLTLGFAAVPIIAGIDKFFHRLTDWTQYLAPLFPNLLRVTRESFMNGVGVVEIAAGCLVALKPSVGGAVVGLWLVGIIINLLMTGSYFDIALRDLGLALGAFSLSRLAAAMERDRRRLESPVR